jgi:hypothetical protein
MKLEGFVLEQIAGAIASKPGRKALLSRLVARDSDYADELAELEAKIETIGHKRREIQDSIVDDTIPLSDGKALLVGLAGQRDRYEQARTELLASVSNVDVDAVETVRWVADNGIEVFDEGLDGRRKRDFARLLFDRIEVEPNGGRSWATPASERVRIFWRGLVDLAG